MSTRPLPSLVVLDLETTGLDPAVHEILEIGAVRVPADLSSVRAEFSAKVRPEHIENADPDGLKVNGYSAEAWKDARPCPEVVREFVQFAQGGMLAGFNVAFDWAFLARALDLKNRPDPWPFDYHIFDVFSVAYHRAIASNVPMTKWTLSAFCEQYGIPVPPKPHRALNDAKRTLELLRALQQA